MHAHTNARQKGRDSEEGKDKPFEMELEREKASVGKRARAEENVEERLRGGNRVKLFAGTHFASKPCSS